MKFDIYCDWSPAAIGIVVVEQDSGVYYSRHTTKYKTHPALGEMEAIKYALELVEDLCLTNVTIHTDHLVLVEALEKGFRPRCKGIKCLKSREAARIGYEETMTKIYKLGVAIEYCKAHSGNPFSNAADVLARNEAKKGPHRDWEYRLSASEDFVKAARRVSKPNPTLWDVIQAWFVNLTYGAVTC